MESHKVPHLPKVLLMQTHGRVLLLLYLLVFQNIVLNFPDNLLIVLNLVVDLTQSDIYLFFLIKVIHGLGLIPRNFQHLNVSVIQLSNLILTNFDIVLNFDDSVNIKSCGQPILHLFDIIFQSPIFDLHFFSLFIPLNQL